jgi:phosphoribosyl 1,2-cyclic phosphodiesterase
MALYISSLNSGSNGNCYYIGSDKEALLIDAGLSCREIETRLKRLGLPVEKIKALFISHEHSDHIKGVAMMSRKYRLPVYITQATRKQARINIDKKLSIDFRDNQPVQIGELCIIPFSKNHDAVDPYSFTVKFRNIHVGVFTDIGKPCRELIRHFKLCHAAFLESNYDEKMLMEGPYPAILKSRISGGKGHLSNAQALDLFVRYKPAHMSHLLLSHLSKNNNDPQLVQEQFNKHAGQVKMIVTSRYEESAVYKIESNVTPPGMTTREDKTVRQLKFSFE